MPRYTLKTLAASGALMLVASERDRHTRILPAGGEGWSAAHDDRHEHGQLGDAAAAYATTLDKAARELWPFDGEAPDFAHATLPEQADQRVTDLVRAGAFILAELDRLARDAQRRGVL